jgi:hypothetical protein
MSDELTKITLELLGKAYARVIDERGVLEGKLVELQSRPIEDALQAKLDDAADAFHKLDNWAKAYPLDIFPVPDLEKARKLLMDGGITLDAVSATAMRHVISGVAWIVSEALKKLEK